MGETERPMGIRASTHGSGVRLNVVELDSAGGHSDVLHIDYTREQATAVVAGIMRCMGLQILVSDVYGRFPAPVSAQENTNHE